MIRVKDTGLWGENSLRTGETKLRHKEARRDDAIVIERDFAFFPFRSLFFLRDVLFPAQKGVEMKRVEVTRRINIVYKSV